MQNPHIGFPPGMLGESPLRLPVLWHSEGLFAVSKPPGLDVIGSPGNEASLESAINQQSRAGKPELRRLGLEQVYSVIPIDPEVGGIALFAMSQPAADFWRNAYGSNRFCLRFVLICRSARTEDEFQCKLPLAWASRQERARVSHRFGKQAETRFTCRERVRTLSCWVAETSFHRPHQIRIHAAESGIEILGESLYARSAPLYLSDLKHRSSRREEENPLNDGICAHLESVYINKPDMPRAEIVAPWPKRMAVLWKQVHRAARDSS